MRPKTPEIVHEEEKKEGSLYLQRTRKGCQCKEVAQGCGAIGARMWPNWRKDVARLALERSGAWIWRQEGEPKSEEREDSLQSMFIVQCGPKRREKEVETELRQLRE